MTCIPSDCNETYTIRGSLPRPPVYTAPQHTVTVMLQSSVVCSIRNLITLNMYSCGPNLHACFIKQGYSVVCVENVRDTQTLMGCSPEL